MDKLEKVINGLECCIDACHGKTVCLDCAYMHDYGGGCEAQLLQDAIALLKAQQPRVLSAEELEHMEPGSVIWIERELLDHSRFMDYGMRIDTDDGPWFRTDDGGAINPMTPDEDYIRSRCWTSRPTPEQREATPWTMS